jgi:hypothetical protein
MEHSPDERTRGFAKWRRTLQNFVANFRSKVHGNAISGGLFGGLPNLSNYQEPDLKVIFLSLRVRPGTIFCLRVANRQPDARVRLRSAQPHQSFPR